MERLTREDWKNPKSMMYEKVKQLNVNDCVKKSITDILKKLAEYEDLEEQGKLLRLPVCVGDAVYRVDENSMKVVERKIDSISCGVYGRDNKWDISVGGFYYTLDEFNKLMQDEVYWTS